MGWGLELSHLCHIDDLRIPPDEDSQGIFKERHHKEETAEGRKDCLTPFATRHVCLIKHPWMLKMLSVSLVARASTGRLVRGQ